MENLKFCVFCGRPPEDKNKEHILPQWLLNLTGDPKRTVTMLYDYHKGREISFSWNALVTPACEACNTKFSRMEASVKPVIEGLLERQSLTAADYVLLLDWLDKVRIGLWLNYQLLQGNLLGVKPSFYISDRVGKKDRFVAIYPLSGNELGLNAFGVNTLAFQGAPSAFGLRVNNLLMINCSSDYIFSGRCGFPSPTSMGLMLDGKNAGCLELGEFRYSKKTKTPLFRHKLAKPSIYLLQPIAQRTTGGEFIGGESFGGGDTQLDSFFMENLMDANVVEVGKLYRQFPDSVCRIEGGDEIVEFDSVKGTERVTFGRLVSQVYNLQVALQDRYVPVALDRNVRALWGEQQKIISKECRAYAKKYLSSSANK